MWSCFRLSSRHALRCFFSRLHLSCSSFQASLQPNQSPRAPGSPRGSTQWVLRFWARHNTTDSRHQCSCCQRSATMFAVFSALYCCAERWFGPPTAFPLIGPQCTVGVFAGTHWSATDTQAGWYQGQSANPLAAATAETAACVRVRPY